MGGCAHPLTVSCECRGQWRPEESIRSLGVGVTGGCELSDMGAGILEEQQALLTSKPSLKHPLFCAWKTFKVPCLLEVMRATGITGSDEQH